MQGKSLNDCNEEERIRAVEAALEQRVVQALETVPEVTVSAGFAARVMERLSEQHSPASISLRQTRYGRNATLGGLAMLLLAMLVLAPQAVRAGVVGVTLQWLACAQFVALVWWLSVEQGRSR